MNEHLVALSTAELESRRLVLRERLAKAWIAREPLADIAKIESELRDVWRAIAAAGDVDDAETAADLDCATCCC